jgi:hypothetical protein
MKLGKNIRILDLTLFRKYISILMVNKIPFIQSDIYGESCGVYSRMKWNIREAR